MWVTTKSIVKDIKRKQEELMLGFNDLTLAQNESRHEIQTQISDLKEKIVSIEAVISELNTKQEVMFSQLLLAISKIEDMLKSISDNLAVSYDSNAKKIEETIKQVSNAKSENVLDSLNSAIKEIVSVIDSVSVQIEEKMMGNIGKMLESEKDISSKVTELSIHSGALERNIYVGVEEMEKRVQEQRNELLEKINRVDSAIAE